MNMRVLSCAAMLAMSSFASAMSVPDRTTLDSRFQTIRYTPDVIRIQAKIGRFLELEFAKDETKIDFVMGDRDAWMIKTVGNTMYIKPKALFADTNMEVITNKRKYWFDLVMAEQKQPLAYHLDFQYPYEPPPPQAATVISPAVLAAQEKKVIDANLSEAMNDVIVKAGSPETNNHALNGDYGLIGPDELMPTAVYDNGEMTFIEFAPHNPMPVVFAKETDGSESRVNYHVEKDILVVHRTTKQLVFRRGSAVACLINGSFHTSGANTTYTTSDKVKRVIKGEN